MLDRFRLLCREKPQFLYAVLAFLAATTALDLALVGDWVSIVQQLRVFLSLAFVAFLATLDHEEFLVLAGGSQIVNLLGLAIFCVSRKLYLPFLGEALIQLLIFMVGFLLNQYLAKTQVPVKVLELVQKALEEEHLQKVQMVMRFSQVGTGADFSKVYDQTMQVLTDYFQVEKATIYLSDPSRTLLRPARTMGFRLEDPNSAIIRPPDYFWSLADYDPQIGMANVLSGKQKVGDIKRFLGQMPMESLAALPLVVEGRTVGLLNVMNSTAPKEFHLNHRLLSTLGFVLSTALQNCFFRGSLMKKVDETQQEKVKIQAQSEILRDAFSKYVSASVVDEIVKRPDAVTLGGKKQKITIMFADLRGFTPLTSQLPLEPLMNLLNDWLERASQRLFEMGGTIDKYMGDGIMAIFGAPLPQTDHAIRSVYAAFQLQEAFEMFRQEHRAVLQDHQLGFGVGIATGTVVVGNLGSRRRMEYTAVGDAVNLAARLEKVAGDQDIIVDQNTFDLLEGRFAHVVLSQIKVKGKDPMDLYKLTAVKTPWK